MDLALCWRRWGGEEKRRIKRGEKKKRKEGKELHDRWRAFNSCVKLSFAEKLGDIGGRGGKRGKSAKKRGKKGGGPGGVWEWDAFPHFFYVQNLNVLVGVRGGRKRN